MSGLVYQNNKNRCQGWTNPTNNLFGPKIYSLSSLYSPAGSTSLVSVNGENFYYYSTISFGTYNPTVYFINSNLLQFYVPTNLNSGTYPVQVFNASIPSNSVNYTIDNSSGYWLLTSNGNISNTNTGITSVTALARGVPVVISEDYIVPDNVTWIVCNSSATTIKIKLPSGNKYIGRDITIRNIGSATINSSSSNIYLLAFVGSIEPLNGQSQIMPPVNTDSPNGTWCTLVCYDGLNWMTMQSYFS
jgi:hypothetical protein